MKLKDMTEEDRFFKNVSQDGNDPVESCWLWTGSATDSRGYGRFVYKRERTRAHRWSWEFFNGVIPDGMTIDHLCMVKGCVNPWHLDVVPSPVNVKRMHAAHGFHRDWENGLCKHGHDLSVVGYVARPRGNECRQCRRDAQNRRYAQVKRSA